MGNHARREGGRIPAWFPSWAAGLYALAVILYAVCPNRCAATCCVGLILYGICEVEGGRRASYQGTCIYNLKNVSHCYDSIGRLHALLRH